MPQHARRFAASLALAAATLFAPLASAQAAPDPRLQPIVTQLMQEFLQQHPAPGALVAISSHGRRSFYTFGQATDAGAPFTPTTLVEIGSCTKVFTTTLFALQVGSGRIDPNTPVLQYLPPGTHLQAAAQFITPLELSNFTSGLPDDPPDLPRRLEARSIQTYTTQDFFRWLSRWQPAGPLPAPYSYSNAGTGLLGYAVQHVAGQPWESFLQQQLLQPLGMADTETTPSPAQRQRLAQGHHPDGSPAPEWPFFAWFAAGALRSTPADMLRFGEANLFHTTVDGRPVPPALTAAMRLAQTPTYQLPDSTAGQAMAWVVNRVDRPGFAPETFKNGGTAGFSSVILTNKPKDLAIFIVLNAGDSNPAGLAVRMGRMLP